jgi:hypothetical protein
MTPVGTGIVSLTKFYSVPGLVAELATVAPGTTVSQVRNVLDVDHVHKELADDIVLYTNGAAIDDPMLQACRATAPSARALVWLSLVMADHRMAEVVETYLTDERGKFIPDHFNADRLEAALVRVLPGLPTRKAATNILSYLRDSGLVEPETHGGTIIGISHANPTAAFVRDAVRYIIFRLQHLQIPYRADVDDADAALQVKANHWLNLTTQEFRSAYDSTDPDDVPEPPPPPPPPEPVPAPPIATEVAVEANNVETFEVSQTARSAVRREQPLVIAYKLWMENQHSTIVRFRFRPPNTPAHLFNDIYDKTRNNLIEAKADATRPSIRMAIGQLMDYRRFAPPSTRLAVLTAHRPHTDLEALLASLEIACIWRVADAFTDNADDRFV